MVKVNDHAMPRRDALRKTGDFCLVGAEFAVADITELRGNAAEIGSDPDIAVALLSSGLKDAESAPLPGMM